MSKTRKILHSDERLDLRVQANRRVFWQINGDKLQGQGRIHNISKSGMLFEAESKIQPEDNTSITFDADLGQSNYIPRKGRLVWKKRKALTKHRYLCGVQFEHPEDFVLTNLERHIERQSRKDKRGRILSAVTKLFLTCVAFALIAFIYAFTYITLTDLNTANRNLLESSQQQALLTQTYLQLYRTTQLELESVQNELEATKVLYQESEGMLASVSKELEATKAILAQTEQLLKEVRQSGSTLESQMQANEEKFSATRTELERTIEQIRIQNQQSQQKLEELELQLEFYEGNAKDLRGAKEKIDAFKKRIKEIKKDLRGFKQEARMTKLIAQEEKDRIESQMGNSGYFMRNGKPVVVDQEQYESVSKSKLFSEVGAPKSNVNINVEFFK